MYEYRVTIDRVVDGDTVDCWIDLGFNTQVFKRVRFLGVNAPETRTRNKEEKAKGLKTKEWLKQKIDPQYAGSETEVILQSHGLGKYGRVLGELYIMKNNKKVSINKEMLRLKLVKEYHGGKRK